MVDWILGSAVVMLVLWNLSQWGRIEALEVNKAEKWDLGIRFDSIGSYIEKSLDAKADKPLLRRKGDKAGPTISGYDNERDGDWTICCKHTKKGAKK